MKKFIGFIALLCMVTLCLFSCNKKEEKIVETETTTKKTEETTTVIKESTTRALNPDIRLNVVEKDKKTKYNVVRFGKYEYFPP